MWLSNKKQQTKIDDNYSSWLGIPFGGPQRSIWGQLLLNTFLVDLFRIVKDIDIASNASKMHLTLALVACFKNNHFERDALVSTNKHLNIKIGDYTIGSSEWVVKIDVNLNFNNPKSELRKKVEKYKNICIS